MNINRIVSFLPSATELIYELGLEKKLFGVTHECKFPQDAVLKPKVISSVIDSEKLTSNEINEMTCQLLNDKKEIFILNENNLKKANPDLIISQETCEVCAAYTHQVSKAVKILKNKPKVHSMDPHNLNEIIDSVRKLGKILEIEDTAEKISESLERRIEHVKKSINENMPKVLAIEWLEPFFTAGHWIPEMIEIAGGINMITKMGDHSRRMEFKEISDVNPDIIILMPCGFDAKRTISEYNGILRHDKKWNSLKAVKNQRVYAVDANSFFSKPSIRTIQGMEILAKIIQPDKFQEIKIPKDTLIHIN